MQYQGFQIPEGWDVVQTGPASAIGRHRDHLGAVELAVHTLFDGILLERIRLSTARLSLFPESQTRQMSVNYCTGGRCECDMGDAGSLVVSEGTLCISSAKAHAFSYPLNSYAGFEYWLSMDQDAATDPVLAAFGIDLGELERRWCEGTVAAVMRPEGETRRLCDALAALLAEDAPDERDLRLATCCLFRNLLKEDPRRGRDAVAYVQRSQRDMARAVHDGIVQDPAHAPDLSPMAEGFGVSASSLRAYFQKVYGCSPAAFARSEVMRAACERLAATDDSVSSIASAAGYGNPSKFSAAFRREVGVNPLEYRRRRRMGESLLPQPPDPRSRDAGRAPAWPPSSRFDERNS